MSRKNPYENVKPLPTKGPQGQLFNPTANKGKGPQGQIILDDGPTVEEEVSSENEE